MADKNPLVLIDASPASLVVEKNVSSDVLGPGFANCAVDKYRMTDGLSQGVDVVDVIHDGCAIKLLPTRGMSIWDVHVKGKRFGWKSPVRGPVHPAFVPLGEPSGLGWLDGFDEMLVRCGLESNGAPEFDDVTGRLKYPLHGRIGNKPAHYVAVSTNADTKELAVQGIVEETRFHLTRLRMTSTLFTKPGQAGLRIRDEIENLADVGSEFQMLYHVNFGLPLLDGGSQVVAAVDQLVPRNAHAAEGIKTWNHYSAPQPGFEEQVYFAKLRAGDDGRTQTLLRNAHGTLGVSLLFSPKQLPCFSLWKDTQGERDGYVTGLEPGTNFPNPRGFEKKQGRVVPLKPGEKAALDLELQFHVTAEEVAAAEKAIKKLAGDKPPQVFDQPQPGWCA